MLWFPLHSTLQVNAGHVPKFAILGGKSALYLGKSIYVSGLCLPRHAKGIVQQTQAQGIACQRDSPTDTGSRDIQDCACQTQAQGIDKGLCLSDTYSRDSPKGCVYRALTDSRDSPMGCAYPAPTGTDSRDSPMGCTYQAPTGTD
jgi:hypothetical protein